MITPENLDQAQRVLIRNLRSDLGDATTDAIADSLQSCSFKALCRSGACPSCGLAFKAAMLQLTERAIRTAAQSHWRGRVSRLTLVQAAGWAPAEDLTAASFEAVREVTMQTLRAAGIEQALVGIEASYNEDQEERFSAHWQVHTCGLSPDWLSAVQEAALRAACQRDELIPRPVVIEKLDERDAGVEYAFKPDRYRRVSYLNRSMHDRAPARSTHVYSLRPWQQVMLAKAEHEFGLGRRALILGIGEDEVKRSLVGFEWLLDEL